MYIIKEEKYLLMPLAFNEFCNDIVSLRDSSKYVGPIQSKRIIDNDVIDEIIAFCNNSDLPIVIDMNNIINYSNRSFSRLLSIENAQIVISRVEESLRDTIEEDLGSIYITIDNSLCSSEKMREFYQCEKNSILNVDHIENLRIVNWMKQCVTVDEVDHLQPLDSSGVYCNMYINAKRLFADPIKYYFIIYQMICMIDNSEKDFDALVSASRNGANIAEIIGWLLNKKVIYCPSLGPRFSLAIHLVDNKIRKNRKYAYIFDFMCLGTEAKMLNALLSFAGASLVEGYGIANYINLEHEYQFGVLNRMNCLIDVQKEKVQYRIAGSKEEIRDILVEGKDSYATRIQEF